MEEASLVDASACHGMAFRRHACPGNEQESSTDKVAGVNPFGPDSERT